MKKILKIILLIILFINIFYINVIATSEEVNRLRLTVTNADEDYQIYILLPKKYIMYAINYDGLNIEYDKANTLIYNNIPSISVDINDIQKDTYIDEENRIEYVQILLDDLGGEEYYFEIIKEYTDMDMLYRIKSTSRDNLLHINNFSLENNSCDMEYNYKENTITADIHKDIKIKFDFEWWQIVAIVVLIIFIIYLYKRRNK